MDIYPDMLLTKDMRCYILRDKDYIFHKVNHISHVQNLYLRVEVQKKTEILNHTRNMG